jgi:hypothetical protein
MNAFVPAHRTRAAEKTKINKIDFARSADALKQHQFKNITFWKMKNKQYWHQHKN